MYHNGMGVQQDYHKAMEYYLKSANQGHAGAQSNIGTHSFYFNYQPFTNLYWSGVLYDNGKGVQQDYHKAMEYYLKAANQGHAIAQFNIGIYSFILIIDY